MAVTTIPWEDGSGDNIYLSASSQVGDGTVSVTSDANTGAARSKVVTFTSGVGGITKTLTVAQEAGSVVPGTLSVNPSGYIRVAAYGLTDPTNAYNDETNTTYALIRLTRGTAGAVTEVYFTFDTSAIPANATIKSVTCKAKVYISNTTSNRVATRQVQMFSGETSMGSSQNATTTPRVVTFSGVTWTRAQVDDVRIRFYATRGTSNLSSDYSFRFYGATLEIEYE